MVLIRHSSSSVIFFSALLYLLNHNHIGRLVLRYHHGLPSSNIAEPQSYARSAEYSRSFHEIDRCHYRYCCHERNESSKCDSTGRISGREVRRDFSIRMVYLSLHKRRLSYTFLLSVIQKITSRLSVRHWLRSLDTRCPIWKTFRRNSDRSS